MTKWNHETLSFSRCRGRRLRVDFSGGSISSNGGSLLLREVDRRLGLTAAVARALGDRRQRGKVRHKVETMVRQRVHAVALGYEDLNDHDGLRDDLVVQTACERDGSLASSSTLCRPETTREMLMRLTGIDIAVCGQCGEGTLRQILILEPRHRTGMAAMKTGPP